VERRRSKKSKVTKNNLRYSPYSHFSVINLLWDDGKLNSYITNFLIPVATAFKDHPALLAWEIMNEPEGIVYAGESDSEPGLFKISYFSCQYLAEIFFNKNRIFGQKVTNSQKVTNIQKVTNSDNVTNSQKVTNNQEVTNSQKLTNNQKYKKVLKLSI